jgi:hypothetical protein
MTTEPKKRDPFSDWRRAAGTRRDCGELELTIPIGQGNYFTITADPDTAAMVPAVLRQLLSQPEPGVAGPSDEDLYDLSDVFNGDVVPAMRRALELWGHATPQPSPVPVAERLPGPEDCDAGGRCWLCGKVEGEWRLISAFNPGVPHLKYCFSHWLPHNALPAPGAEVG